MAWAKVQGTEGRRHHHPPNVWLKHGDLLCFPWENEAEIVESGFSYLDSFWSWAYIVRLCGGSDLGPRSLWGQNRSGVLNFFFEKKLNSKKPSPYFIDLKKWRREWNCTPAVKGGFSHLQSYEAILLGLESQGERRGPFFSTFFHLSSSKPKIDFFLCCCPEHSEKDGEVRFRFGRREGRLPKRRFWLKWRKNELIHYSNL